ncbi:MAG: flagellar biosynthetic protein FliR [Bryobacterales bacterium]|jgi:flagellar biosynthetic protein FliR|nr:flagellar biosynthetic protein FliR [Bryobacterales bacterium]
MPVNLLFTAEQMTAFLLVLSRMAGLMIFLPVPGLRAIPETLRPLVALALTFPLLHRLPALPDEQLTAGTLVLWCLGELTFGLLWGLAVHFLIEAFVLGAQFLALQAGYGYASMVDPSTQADAGLLQILAQLMASLLFFATGLHRQILYLMAESITRIPPGQFAVHMGTAESLIGLGSTMLEVAARLAMPLLALLLLIDLALALLGRVQAQLQLLPLVFPAKLLASLLVLGLLTGAYTRVFQSFGREILSFLRGVVLASGAPAG